MSKVINYHHSQSKVDWNDTKCELEIVEALKFKLLFLELNIIIISNIIITTIKDKKSFRPKKRKLNILFRESIFGNKILFSKDYFVIKILKI